MSNKDIIVLTFILTEAAVLSALLLFYTFERKTRPSQQRMINSLIVNHIFFGLLTYGGLLINQSSGHPPEILLSLINSSSSYAESFNWLKYIGIGISSGLILILLDWLLFRNVGKVLAQTEIGKINLYQKLLAIPYASIGEEVIFRLGIQSFIAAGLLLMVKNGTIHSYKIALPSILITSLLFGWAHLPIIRKYIAVSKRVIFRSLFLNGMAGVVLGYVYIQNGLEAAIFTHLSIDLSIALLPAIIALIIGRVSSFPFP